MAATTVDSSVEEQGPGPELEEGASVTVMKWSAEKLTYSDTVDPSLDSNGKITQKLHQFLVILRVLEAS